MKKYSMVVLYGLVAITIGVALFLFTPLGLGESPDSIAYLKGAQGLLAGHGFSYMSGQWPPLYPMAIAASAYVLHQDSLVGARVLQAALYASNFLLIAYVLRRFARAPNLLAFVSAGVLCLHPVMMHIHFYAWSEPLFIALIFANMLVLSHLAQKSFAFNWTLLLAFLSGLALLTRFVGVAMIATNCLVLLWVFWSETRRRRIMMVLIQVLIPAIMYAPWIGHKAVSDGPAIERWLSFTFLSLDLAAKALATVGTWLLPWKGLQYDPQRSSLTLLLGLFLLVLPVVVAIVANLRAVNRRQFVNQTIMGLFACCYVGFVLTAWMFVDSKVHLDNRMMSPLVIFLFVCFFYLLLQIKQGIICGLCVASLVLLLGSGYQSARGIALFSKYNGLELAGKELSLRPLNQFISGCPKQLRVFADLPWNVELYFSTKVFWLPAPTLYYKGISNINYEVQMAELARLADLIILQNQSAETIQVIDRLETFSRVYEKADGIVWQNNLTVSAAQCR
jgi:hypothetical protein